MQHGNVINQRNLHGQPAEIELHTVFFRYLLLLDTACEDVGLLCEPNIWWFVAKTFELLNQGQRHTQKGSGYTTHRGVR